MKVALRLVLAIAGVGLVAVPLVGQPTGTRMGTTATSKDVPLVLARIGNCIVQGHPGIVRKWLLHVPGSEFEREYVMTQEGALSVCMEHGDSRVVTKGRLTYVASELRPYVAAAAARSVADQSPATLPLDPKASAWFIAPLWKLDVLAPRDKVALIQQDFGHCVMMANWSTSRDLIRSTPNSKQEDAAIAALMPALGPCIPEGTTVTLTKANVRKALNEPFYHAVTDRRREAAE